MLVRQYDFSIQERVGVQKDRHTPLSQTLDHSQQTLCVVHMAMTQNNAMQILWSYFEHVHIVDERIGTHTRIEEQAGRAVTRLDAHQSGIAVLGNERLALSPWQSCGQSGPSNLIRAR